jgi:hypothetical protein
VIVRYVTPRVSACRREVRGRNWISRWHAQDVLRRPREPPDGAPDPLNGNTREQRRVVALLRRPVIICHDGDVIVVAPLTGLVKGKFGQLVTRRAVVYVIG